MLSQTAREAALKVNRPSSGASGGAVQSVYHRDRKRFGQKAQVQIKTQLLACVLNLFELEYSLGGEKTKGPNQP